MAIIVIFCIILLILGVIINIFKKNLCLILEIGKLTSKLLIYSANILRLANIIFSYFYKIHH